MATDPNVARLRWLLTEASKTAGITLSVNMINRICAEEDALMRGNEMLRWQTEINDEAAKIAAQMTEA